ncbi:MAG: thioredoxin domain-containing protein, partial [Planctomycetota bacterium]
IGYSSCHWCHVMEHESFEDDETARLMNEHFVCVKVDREERPDVDEIYMTAVTAMGAQGGWPLSAFLTPDGKPFTGGTYFPREDMYGRPGFLRILKSIAEAWADAAKRKEIEEGSRGLVEALQQLYDQGQPARLGPEALKEARDYLEGNFDATYGGFGDQPKFPSPSSIELLLRFAVRGGDDAALAMAERTLEAMARGGIHDHVGGGFHRYSVTRDWLIPHFEKMLYDNAQLLSLYAWAHAITGKELYARTARDIASWVLREMTDPSGGFHSAQDADDPGGPEGEGGFYVWTPAELRLVLGEEEARAVALHFGVTSAGNWHDKPGKTILQTTAEGEKAAALGGARLKEARRKLHAAREKRPKPMTDTKVLADWNGLMISGFCRAFQALGDEKYLGAALRAGRFLRENLTTKEGRLLRRWRDGDAAHGGVLEDYAFVVAAYLDLYESSLEPEWLEEALRLSRVAVELFEDAEDGGFFSTSAAGERLLARAKSGYDQARPSGNGVMAMNLLRIAELTGDGAARERARKTLECFGGRVSASALGFSALLNALDFAQEGTREIFVAGPRDDPRTRALIEAVWRDPDPNRVLALVTPGVEKLLPPAAGKAPVQGKPAAYVCRDFVCAAPVTEPPLPR